MDCRAKRASRPRTEVATLEERESIGRGRAKQKRPQMKFGENNDREDVVKELPFEPGDSGGA